MPITYNVYNTYDINGQRKGLLINEDGPIPLSEDFTYVATRVNPIIVSVSDASGETLEYVMAPEVTNAPEESQKDDTNTDDDLKDLSDFTDVTDDILMKDFKPQKLLAIIKNTDDFYLKSRYINSVLASQNVIPLGSETASNYSNSREQNKSQIEFRYGLL